MHHFILIKLGLYLQLVPLLVVVIVIVVACSDWLLTCQWCVIVVAAQIET